jgi:hypothetical protein
MNNEEKINRLKELIDGSASFGEADKKKLIAKIPELKPEEIDEAIRVFEEEIEDWKAIYNKHEENKALLLDLMGKSQHEISQMSKNFIKKSERGEHEVEEAEAEDLLKTIK